MNKGNIEIIYCINKAAASKKALEILLNNVNAKTLVLLSGGTSPDLLYKLIAENQSLRPGAVALIDERYGVPMHNNSNEKRIAETGIIDYLNKERIPFYRVLVGKDMENTAKEYEQTIEELFKKFPQKIAVMGIGADGHTAGIKPDLEYDHSKLVISFDDVNGSFGKRVTLTFEALDQIDEFVILALGESKKEALGKMFTSSDKQKLPASFYNECFGKATVLTDLDIMQASAD